MTITLHWWALPILLMLISIAWAALLDDGGSLDFRPALIVIAGVIGSVMLTIGHFI